MATGDSVTSAHLQRTYHFPMGQCVGNTAEDNVRHLPGNDMMFSYAGKYATNLNRNVVEYFNFARTGYTTSDILGAGWDTPDACHNPWHRNSSPADLAERAIRQAKAEKKAAYFVSTGGVNDTNWTEVLTALTECGTIDYYKQFAQEYFTKHNKPWQAVMKWFDGQGNYAAKSAVINGGSCHLRVEGDITDHDYFHKKIDVPVYNGPTHYNAIKQRVTDIIETMLAAGADKVVWMGYYDISPARLDFGAFGETYRQKVSKVLQDMLPGRIPFSVRPLLDDPGWQQTVGQWTAAMNNAIWQGVPQNEKVRFVTPPALRSGDIQQTGLGGCPHPNEPGHTALANALDRTFG
ncbi:hypothetical protein O7635_01470 [Asanoa sp. WMMD1127]|uniref:hypothetical protein n=1 Tax=Asanoa sp. WMMD1127 TaxID=3016107 RepID=UPI0024168B86|nr:hypothetical protein [Asanoa sp. WMMD1127]MDG4820521.1 hypothetical protein [Asanoa sp. WMMD1127]